MDTDDALSGLESQTEEQTRTEHGELAQLSGNLINLFRRGLDRVHESFDAESDFEQLRLLLLVRTAGALQSGRSLALRGYYVQGLAAARGVLEDIACLMYFSRRPEQSSRALSDPEFGIAIKTALEEHEIPDAGLEMANLCAKLSQATHPSALSMTIHPDEGRLRVQEYSSESARSALIYLVALGQHLLHVMRDVITDRLGDRDDDWIGLTEELDRDAEQWNASHRSPD